MSQNGLYTLDTIDEYFSLGAGEHMMRYNKIDALALGIALKSGHYEIEWLKGRQVSIIIRNPIKIRLKQGCWWYDAGEQISFVLMFFQQATAHPERGAVLRMDFHHHSIEYDAPEELSAKFEDGEAVNPSLPEQKRKEAKEQLLKNAESLVATGRAETLEEAIDTLKNI